MVQQSNFVTDDITTFKPHTASEQVRYNGQNSSYTNTALTPQFASINRTHSILKNVSCARSALCITIKIRTVKIRFFLYFILESNFLIDFLLCP